MNAQAQGQDFDPEAPFIAQDGLEYEDLASYLCGKPANCWRNTIIQEHRAKGRSEAAICEWIKGFDGADPTPSLIATQEVVNWRTYVADKALGNHYSSRARPAPF